ALGLALVPGLSSAFYAAFGLTLVPALGLAVVPALGLTLVPAFGADVRLALCGAFLPGLSLCAAVAVIRLAGALPPFIAAVFAAALRIRLTFVAASLAVALALSGLGVSCSGEKGRQGQSAQ